MGYANVFQQAATFTHPLITLYGYKSPLNCSQWNIRQCFPILTILRFILIKQPDTKPQKQFVCILLRGLQ